MGTTATANLAGFNRPATGDRHALRIGDQWVQMTESGDLLGTCVRIEERSLFVSHAEAMTVLRTEFPDAYEAADFAVRLVRQ